MSTPPPQDTRAAEIGRDYDAVQLHWPAVRAHAVPGGLGLGKRVTVRLVEADPSRRRVRFAPA